MSNTEEFEKNGLTGATLVIMQTKPNYVGEAYVVVGELKDNTPTEITITKASSPTIRDNSTTIQLHQHLLPSTLIAAECMEDVVTVIRKDHLTFFSMLRLDDPHPVCEEYRRFWNMDILEEVVED